MQVIDFNDYANDLHLSEWASFIRLEAVDLEAAALRHEDGDARFPRGAVTQSIEHLESLIEAMKRTLNKGAPQA
jgi:hypothetical protein